VDLLTATAFVAAALAAAGAWRMYRRVLRAERHVETLHCELVSERHAASHDPLTDLVNRRAFYQRGVAVVADRGRHPLVAFVLDLDYLKQINDRFGHAAGDEVLIATARRLAAYAGGNLVARLGGDEFAGLLTLPSTENHRLHDVAVDLGEVLSIPIDLGDHKVKVSASVGLAAVRGRDIAHFAEALRQADHDMYRTKAARRAPHLHHTAASAQRTAVRSAAPTRATPTQYAVRSTAAAVGNPGLQPTGQSNPPRSSDLPRR
jgi:diguanylate cyclase